MSEGSICRSLFGSRLKERIAAETARPGKGRGSAQGRSGRIRPLLDFPVKDLAYKARP